MSRRILRPTVLVAALSSLLALGGMPSEAAPSSTAPCGSGSAGGKITHVIWIMEENNSEDQIVGNTSLPYLNSLISACGLATNYHNISHSSLPNYVGSTSDQVQGGAWYGDGSPGRYPQSQDNLFHQIDGVPGLSWADYAEGMPKRCAQVSDLSTYYVVRHNPAPYYDDITGRDGSTNHSCKTKDLPLGDPAHGKGNHFYNALYRSSGQGLPSFSFVAPNLCNDMHGLVGVCSGDTLYSSADSWLRTWLTAILRSPQYVAGNVAVFVTWDEGSGPDATSPEDCWAEQVPGDAPGGKESCWVATAVMSPYVTPGSTFSAATNHYDLLAATQSLLGLPTLALGATSGSPDGTASAFLVAFGLS